MLKFCVYGLATELFSKCGCVFPNVNSFKDNFKQIAYLFEYQSTNKSKFVLMLLNDMEKTVCCLDCASPLTLFTQTSGCIFSVLFSVHFPRCLQGEFVEQSSATLVGDYFHYSNDLGV